MHRWRLRRRLFEEKLALQRRIMSRAWLPVLGMLPFAAATFVSLADLGRLLLFGGEPLLGQTVMAVWMGGGGFGMLVSLVLFVVLGRMDSVAVRARLVAEACAMHEGYPPA